MCKISGMRMLVAFGIVGVLLFPSLGISKTTTKKTTTEKSKTKQTTSVKETPSKEVSSKYIESHFKPNTFAVNLGIGFGFLYGAIEIYPGVEYTFYQFNIDKKIPFDVGAAVKGVYWSYNSGYLGGNYGVVCLGAGVFATLHFGPKSLNDLPDFLRRMDVYIGLGVRFFNVSYTGDAAYLNSLGYNYGWFGVATTGGVSYFITDHFAIELEGSYYGFASGLIGVTYKF